jgi:hypothetical protein
MICKRTKNCDDRTKCLISLYKLWLIFRFLNDWSLSVERNIIWHLIDWWAHKCQLGHWTSIKNLYVARLSLFHFYCIASNYIIDWKDLNSDDARFYEGVRSLFLSKTRVGIDVFFGDRPWTPSQILFLNHLFLTTVLDLTKIGFWLLTVWI